MFITAIYILLTAITVGVVIYASVMGSKVVVVVVICIVSLAILARLFNYLVKVNYIILLLSVDGMLMLFGKERDRLYRNIVILDELTKGWWGGSSRGGGMVIGASGGISYSGGSGGSFGGFGGGSFGGGGAGGSW